MNTLSIDTSSNEVIAVGVHIDGKKFVSRRKTDKQKAQVVLPMVDELLKKHNHTFQDLNAIEVNVGPGSYTGLRVGVSIANTMSFLLKIPINGKPLGEFAQPVYS